jgi:N-acetylglucosaminyl-diphospho-decaprenol L-rhamnosyltransferase
VTPEVSIILVTYECREWARTCLSSIYEGTHDVGFEVVVVDNASTDGTADTVSREFSGVRLLALPENIGFARGANRGASEASGEYLLLLNPDTVVHEGAVSRLLEFARLHPEHGIYGGRTLRPDGRLDPRSCWGQQTIWSLFCFATMLTTAFKRSRVLDPESLGRWERDTVRQVGMVTGCLLLVPARLWQALGGFDERFFMYGEDADLSLRATRLGFHPVITPDAVVIHEVGASSRNRPDKMTLVLQSRATLIRKHWHPWRRRFGLGMLWFGAGLRAILASAAPRRRRDDALAWREVWRARRHWLAGYPPLEATEAHEGDRL